MKKTGLEFIFLIVVILIFIISKFSIAQTTKPELVVQIGHTRTVNSVCFSPDGKYALSGSGDNTLKLWDISTGKEIRTFSGHIGSVTSVCFSPDGKYALSGSEDSTLKLWDISTGKEIRTFKGHSFIVYSGCFSPDGKYALSGSGAFNNSMKLWDINTGEEIRTFKGQGVGSLCFSPDGKYVLSGNINSKLTLWDISTGENIRTFSGHSNVIFYVCFSPDGKYALSGSYDKTLKLWDINTGMEIKTFRGHSEWVTSVCFSPDGKYALSGSGNSTVKLWDINSGKEIRTFTGHYDYVNSVCFSPDGKYALSGSGDETIILWDIDTGEKIRIFKGHNWSVTFAAFSTDGKYVLSGIRNTFKLWDINSGKENKSFTGHTKNVTSVSFSPDGKYIVSGSEDSEVKLWEVQTGREINTFKGHSRSVTSVSFSPDGKYIASGSSDETVILWEVQTGREIRSFASHGYFVCFSPDGKYALSNSGQYLELLDISTGKEIRTFSDNESGGHRLGPVLWCTSVSFSPDGKYALSGSIYNTLILWDISTGKKIRTFEGHSDAVTSVSFSPDGKYALSGSKDYTLKLWDISTGKEIRTFTGHNGSVTSVSFSPNGKYIASGSKDNKIKIWNAESGKENVSLISNDSTDWAVVTPEGLFDASEGGMKNMHFVVNTPDGPEPIDLEQLKHRYYQPDLLPILLGYNKSELRIVPEFDNIRLYPKLNLELDSIKGQLNINLINRGGGIGKVSVYIDNIELITDARNNIAEDSVREEMNIPVDLTKFSEKLNYGAKNTLKVIAFNSEGYLQSRPSEITYTPFSRDAKGDTIRLVPKTDFNTAKFWAVVVGTSNIGLKFAAKDAMDFGNGIKIGADNLFGTDKVNIQLLTTDIQDENLQPTKINIKNSLDALKSSSPDDIVLIYFSGHGITYNSDFYYLTLGASSTDKQYLSDPSIRENYALSNNELTDIINQIPARKKVLIFDACASGKAVENIAYNTAREVPPDQKIAFEIMKDRTGLYLLAGCAADNVSYETSKYGQGLLTYSLLMGIRGAKLRTIENAEFIDVPLLFAYTEEQVPLLATGIGGIQQPFYRCPDRTGTIIIGKLNAEDKNKIFLSEPKPVFMPSRITNTDLLGEDIKLEDLINKELNIITSKGTGAEMILIEAKGYPDAYQIKGMYTISGEDVEVNYILMKQDKPVTEKKSVKGKVGSVNVIVDNIIKSVIALIKK